ncbi:MAG: CDP-2,3-bis-(O-geranylgeranyl)-sn-glycerol synthase [Candidatus Micrarchaeota archaeon]
MDVQTLFELIIFIIPAYIANSAPVVFGGGDALDGGRVFSDKRPVFGSSKTLRGFLAGVAFGALAGVCLALFAGSFYFPSLDNAGKIFLATALSLGAMLGDLAGSFAKRRLAMRPGAPSLFLDQLPFFLGALALGALAWPGLPQALGIDGFLVLAFLTVLLHAFFNFLANKAGLKKVPW